MQVGWPMVAVPDSEGPASQVSHLDRNPHTGLASCALGMLLRHSGDAVGEVVNGRVACPAAVPPVKDPPTTSASLSDILSACVLWQTICVISFAAL